jgi:hypothetical protein
LAETRNLDILLKLEWAAVAVAAALAYRWLDGGWLLFAVLVLAPDLSMLGYLGGPRIGARCYNLVHTLLGPGLLAAAGLAAGEPLATQVAAVWLFHIAVDRALGYGLKLPGGFQETHLGRIGRDR